MEYKDYELIIRDLIEKKNNTTDEKERENLSNKIKKLCHEANQNLTSWDRVCIARNRIHPKAEDYIKRLFTNFVELHGDRFYGDDKAIISGIGLFHDIPVTVIAQAKGKTTEENIERNFGMSNPEGYRKAIRIAKQAEKFKRPIITFVDTAGAYPGKDAEERGQAEAIAKCLYEFSTLETPVICVVIGEGGIKLSGGEKQRISIARAILKNAPIIVLDEVTSYSDIENEAKIQEALRTLLKGKTAIIIAHRLYTIKNADNIVVMNKGRITEQGTHKELLQNKSEYWHLWNLYNDNDLMKNKEI